MKRVAFLILLTAMLSPILTAQLKLDYQKPSEEILKLVDVPLAPSVLLDDKQEHMLLLYRDAFKSIEELSRKEMRLGGLRIDPVTNIGSRTRYYNALKVKNLVEEDSEIKEVSGLPEAPKLTNFT